MVSESKQDEAAQALLPQGEKALERGAWAEARDLFEQSLRAAETPEALEGLGRACAWLDEVIRVGEVRERAYRIYRERGDDHGRPGLP